MILFKIYCKIIRLLCPWASPGRNTGVCCRALLQGISLTPGSKPHLLCPLPWQVGSLPLAPPGSPENWKGDGKQMSVLTEEHWIGRMGKLHVGSLERAPRLIISICLGYREGGRARCRLLHSLLSVANIPLT